MKFPLTLPLIRQYYMYMYEQLVNFILHHESIKIQTIRNTYEKHQNIRLHANQSHLSDLGDIMLVVIRFGLNEE